MSVVSTPKAKKTLVNTAQSASPPAAPKNTASVTLGPWSVKTFTKFRGFVTCDKTGTLTIQYLLKPGGSPVFTKGILADGMQTVNTYDWNEDVWGGQYVQIVFQNTSGLDATTFTAFNEALP